jgi:hypothetical protein
MNATIQLGVLVLSFLPKSARLENELKFRASGLMEIANGPLVQGMLNFVCYKYGCGTKLRYYA